MTAIEVWRFHNEDADAHVLLDGVDVFRTPARVLLARLSEQGHDVQDADDEYPRVSGLTLAFTRTAGHEVPMDTDGMPLYFESVLVAAEDYY
ncbi:hypothetical protein [Actinomadura miaoliensis]|uniref:hypothetical protein n=1 Tax=Actinomadura miaoliensis TaxID=430685 RepID=UPI0031EABEEA